MTLLLARLQVLRLTLRVHGLPSGGLILEWRLSVGATTQREGHADGFSEVFFG